MPDVSVPPTHPDDELVTRKILREELSKYPTKEELREELAKALSNYPTKEELATSFAKYDELIAGRFKGFEDSIRSWIVPLFEPYRDGPVRVRRLENRVDGLETRTDALEARTKTLEARRLITRSGRTKTRTGKRTRTKP